jgi:hypothetical protein
MLFGRHYVSPALLPTLAQASEGFEKCHFATSRGKARGKRREALLKVRYALQAGPFQDRPF